MPIIDFTFNNPAIRDFFLDKPGVRIPVSELLYVHTHWMPESFMTQLERYFAICGEVLKDNPKLASKIPGLPEVAEKYASLLGSPLNEEGAAEVLKVLRELYKQFLKVDGGNASPVQNP